MNETNKATERVTEVTDWIYAILDAVFLTPECLTVAVILAVCYTMKFSGVLRAMITPFGMIVVGPLFFMFSVSNAGTRQIPFVLLYPETIRLFTGLMCGMIAYGIHWIILRHVGFKGTFTGDTGQTQIMRRDDYPQAGDPGQEP